MSIIKEKQNYMLLQMQGFCVVIIRIRVRMTVTNDNGGKQQ